MKSKIKLPKVKKDGNHTLLSGEMGGNDKRINYMHIALGVTIVGVIGYHLLYKHRPAQQPTLVASMEEPAPIKSEPTDLELQNLHRDELEELFSVTSSISFKSRIVNELTRRGYQVMRSITDPTFLKVSTGQRATMNGLRV